MSSPDLTTAAARKALEAGDAQRALTCLRWQCRAPGFHEHPDALGDAMGLFAQLCRHFDDQELAKLASDVAASPSDPQALYELGWAFVERELYAMAVAVLARANTLAPDEPPIVSELAIALEAEGKSDTAIAVLEGSPGSLDSNFPCRYLLALNAVLAGSLPRARDAAPAQRPENADEHRLARDVDRMLDRAGAVSAVTPLDGKDLRGWHFVTTASVLLHLSPFGFDEGMCGRYAFTSDSYERIHYILARLRLSLDALGCCPARVMAPEDRESQAVAMAAAQILGLPLEPLDEEPGVIVVYDPQRLSDDALSRVSTRHPGQVLFAHAVCWTSFGRAPDLVGLLHQVSVAPWDEHTRLAGPAEPQTRVPADDSPAEVLAQRILDATASSDDELAPRDNEDDVRELCEAARPLFATGSGSELRPMMPRGAGPVKSSKFE